MDVPSVWRPKLLLVALAGACIWSYPTFARAEGSGEAEWIWGAAEDEQLPSACWFRKTFDVPEVESARVQITADDRFELFVNGRRVGTGKDWKVLASYDIRKFLVAGRNAIAVKAENLSGKTAGVVAQVTVKQPGHTDVSYSTDASWRVSTHEVTGWERARFNDATWPAAHSFGELGSAAPWGDQITSADGSPIKRFRVARDFRIERVLRGSMTGSLIAMTFNEWGEILASREGGPLELMIDRNQDGVPDTVTVYCDQVKNTQGILALNGEVFVVATGPQGAGLYRLNDDDRDGKADKVQRLVEFAGEMTEHGPHVPVLGPDGLLYVMLGNHTAVKKSFDPQSPYHRFYEGDLPQPKYEDPNLDAAGVKAPGGMVIRTDTEGSFVQLFAGGLRNAYDMAFTPRGDLLTCDSDMEWDIGTPWYRPTRVLQLAAGGEFGWRSGWSCWPDYYLDGLPTTLDTGRGSPAGIETYDHWAYPPQYHDTLFVADWSQGRITAVHLKPEGAGYEARSEVFLEGRPLNVTDLAVGPDGALYFSTGGRGTEGGIYRIVWNGKAIVPEIKDPILRAVRQPQIASAWARQKIAGIQEQLGDQWGPQLTDLIEDTSARADDRCRAMQMTQLYGPAIDGKMLARLCQDKQVVVRAKAAWLLGLTPDQTSAKALFRLMNDPDALVRASAIEAINRGVYDVPIDRLVVRLADTDRHVAWAARRTLEEFPVEDWKQKVLGAKETRAFLVGAVALLAVEPDRKSAEAIVERGRTLMQGYLSDPDFLDLLRVFELAVIRGKLEPGDTSEFRAQLAHEYPSADPQMNRELLRVLVQLQATEIIPRMLEELEGKASDADKLHTAMMARFITSGWTAEQKLALVEYLETAWKIEGGLSVSGYLESVARDCMKMFQEAELRRILARGDRWPNIALAALAALPEHPAAETIWQAIMLDRETQTNADDPAVKRLRTGLVAVLGVSGDAGAMEHLRASFEKQPERRGDLAIGLSQSPGGENWALLVRALPVLDGVAAQIVLSQLATVDRRPEGAEPIRQAILAGLRAGPDAAGPAGQLLTKWVGPDSQFVGDKAPDSLAGWQQWFARRFPEVPPAVLPGASEGVHWSEQEILDFLAVDADQANGRRGAMVFEKAQCVKCHRYGKQGEAIGPDLSTVSQRFQKREILESILFPSHTISDQYSSKTVTTSNGLSFTGIVGALADGTVVVLQPNGQKTTIRKGDIEEIVPSPKSAMPEGLLDSLTLEDIADLFAYLGGTVR